ncbi:PD-(D/E)XK motif protein [Jatrophihabitans fulvus]
MQAGSGAQDAFLVGRLASRRSYLAGADSTGAPVVAIEVQESPTVTPSISLQSLSVQFDLHCLASFEDEEVDVVVALLRCPASDSQIRELFFDFCASVLHQLPEPVSSRDVDRVVHDWIRLFWQLLRAPAGELTGLVGEIAMIASAANPDRWVDGWHDSSGDRMDFVFPEQGFSVEVKTTRGRGREHIVSLNQMTETATQRNYLASFQLEFRTSGVALGDLARRVAADLTRPECVRKFWEVLTEQCGSRFHEFMTARFNLAALLGSCQLFDIALLPCPQVHLPLPAGISNLQYGLDLTFAAPLSRPQTANILSS